MESYLSYIKWGWDLGSVRCLVMSPVFKTGRGPNKLRVGSIPIHFRQKVHNFRYASLPMMAKMLMYHLYTPLFAIIGASPTGEFWTFYVGGSPLSSWGPGGAVRISFFMRLPWFDYAHHRLAPFGSRNDKFLIKYFTLPWPKKTA